MSIWAHDNDLLDISCMITDAAEANGYDENYLIDIAWELVDEMVADYLDEHPGEVNKEGRLQNAEIEKQFVIDAFTEVSQIAAEHDY